MVFILYVAVLHRRNSAIDEDSICRLIDESIQRHLTQFAQQYSFLESKNNGIVENIVNNDVSRSPRISESEDDKNGSKSSLVIVSREVAECRDSSNPFTIQNLKKHKRKMSNASTKSWDTTACSVPNDRRLIVGSRFLHRSRDSLIAENSTIPHVSVCNSVDHSQHLMSENVDNLPSSHDEALRKDSCYFPCIKLSNGFKLLESPVATFLKSKNGRN